MWRYWPALPGVLLVAFTLREVFRDLFHPSSRGSLSEFIAGTIFNLFRRFPRLLKDAGPLSIVLVIFTWAVFVSLGFSLIYWSLPPNYFKIEAGRPPMGFWPMVYFSLELMTTLGLGDYAPIPTWVRLLAVFEALVGFAILTASVSSIVLVHPALGRMQTLARRISVVVRAKKDGKFSLTEPGATRWLEVLAADLVRTRVDLIHFPIVYYFHAAEDHASLPRALPFLVEFVNDVSSNKNNEDLRQSAALVSIALKDLAETLQKRFVQAESSDYEAVFQAYLQHHISL
jgi:hypothetical protein